MLRVRCTTDTLCSGWNDVRNCRRFDENNNSTTRSNAWTARWPWKSTFSQRKTSCSTLDFGDCRMRRAYSMTCYNNYDWICTLMIERSRQIRYGAEPIQYTNSGKYSATPNRLLCEQFSFVKWRDTPQVNWFNLLYVNWTSTLTYNCVFSFPRALSWDVTGWPLRNASAT